MLVNGNVESYEVEFVSLDEQTVAMSLYADQVRPISRGEIAHTRPLASA